MEADVEKSENEKIVQPFRLWRPHSSPNAYTRERQLTRTASEMEVCLLGWKYLKVFGIVDMKSLYVDLTMLAPITSQQMDEQVTPNGSHLPVVTLVNVNQYALAWSLQDWNW